MTSPSQETLEMISKSSSALKRKYDDSCTTTLSQQVAVLDSKDFPTTPPINIGAKAASNDFDSCNVVHKEPMSASIDFFQFASSHLSPIVNLNSRQLYSSHHNMALSTVVIHKTCNSKSSTSFDKKNHFQTFITTNQNQSDGLMKSQSQSSLFQYWNENTNCDYTCLSNDDLDETNSTLFFSPTTTEIPPPLTFQTSIGGPSPLQNCDIENEIVPQDQNKKNSDHERNGCYPTKNDVDTQKWKEPKTVILMKLPPNVDKDKESSHQSWREYPSQKRLKIESSSASSDHDHCGFVTGTPPKKQHQDHKVASSSKRLSSHASSSPIREYLKKNLDRHEQKTPDLDEEKFKNFHSHENYTTQSSSKRLLDNNNADMDSYEIQHSMRQAGENSCGTQVNRREQSAWNDDPNGDFHPVTHTMSRNISTVLHRRNNHHFNESLSIDDTEKNCIEQEEKICSNISFSSLHDGGSERRSCHCKKSRCLKLYCECFSASLLCDPHICSCNDCHNIKVYEEVRKKAIEYALSRNPLAFTGKLTKAKKRAAMLKYATSGGSSSDHTIHPSLALELSSSSPRGCNCKKSLCLKKYCDCFYTNVFCSQWCKCRDCYNFEGSERRAGAMKKKEDDEIRERERYEKSLSRRQLTDLNNGISYNDVDHESQVKHKKVQRIRTGSEADTCEMYNVF